MNKWKKGWKVINKETRCSCTHIDRTKPVKYKKNTVVGRPLFCGPLAVFKTRKAARNFIYTNGKFYQTMCVVKCLYIESKHREVWERADRFEHVWDSCIHEERLPDGTILAEKIKCLE